MLAVTVEDCVDKGPKNRFELILAAGNRPDDLRPARRSPWTRSRTRNPCRRPARKWGREEEFAGRPCVSSDSFEMQSNVEVEANRQPKRWPMLKRAAGRVKARSNGATGREPPQPVGDDSAVILSIALKRGRPVWRGLEGLTAPRPAR